MILEECKQVLIKLNQLKEEGKIEIYTKYQLDSVQRKWKKLKVLILGMMIKH